MRMLEGFPMTAFATASETELAARASAWLKAFDAALQNGDAQAGANLFLPDGHWRDLVALTWNIQTEDGRDAMIV